MAVRLTSLLLVAVAMVEVCTNYEELTEDIHIYDGADFDEVTKTTLFVDKTLLIKRIFDSTKYGSGILIRTPNKFGKSTNLNMIKRFFEINIDDKGDITRSEETKNYKIFQRNYLNIYKIKQFFCQHFGKYPVIFIDYKPLSKVATVEQMIAIFFRDVMSVTFSPHEYLLNDNYLWKLNRTLSWVDKDKFERFIDPKLNYNLTEADIRTGFSFLSKLLHKRYETQVLVLVDNLDSFVDSPLYTQNPDIFHLMSAVNCDLLKCESVGKSVVTGPIRGSGLTVAVGDLLPSNIVEDPQVWPYFGLSGAELEELLRPILSDPESLERAIGRIVHSYSGYSVATFEVGEGGSGQLLDTQTCSVWSVIQYLEKELGVDNFSSLV
uniref:AAA-ATPase-like domain-containing protein n=1 Tax=Graphocephala atropunctata TaxID=36148 RepID=A0A1B6M205_9HEMI